MVRALKGHVAAHLYASSMSVPAVVQSLSALRVTSGADGSTRGAQKLAALRDNGNYLRQRLKDMGCIVLGVRDSPVVVRCNPNSTQI